VFVPSIDSRQSIEYTFTSLHVWTIISTMNNMNNPNNMNYVHPIHMTTDKSALALPTYTLSLRLSQIIIAILILILNIVSLAILGAVGALSYGIFTPLATVIIVGYWYFATYRRMELYSRWAILILDCFAVVWWLSMWCVLAEWAAAFGVLDSLENEYGIGSSSISTVHALTAVAAVLCAAEL
jgi:hypothetical protein